MTTPKSPDYLPQSEAPEEYYYDSYLEQMYEERTHLEDDGDSYTQDDYTEDFDSGADYDDTRGEE